MVVTDLSKPKFNSDHPVRVTFPKVNVESRIIGRQHNTASPQGRGRDMYRQTRNGVTLVEIMVVCAIIGLLAAILLPAIQIVRGAARRLDCSSRMKQVGIAIHSYHGTHNCLPPAHGDGSWAGTSAWYFLLPELGMQDISMKIHTIEDSIFTTGWTASDLKFRAPVLQCSAASGSSDFGINFAVNWGGDGIGKLVNGVRTGSPNNGVFIPARKLTLSLSSITDGTSNTAMVSEFVRGPGNPDILLPGRPVDRSIPNGLIINLIPGATAPLDVDFFLSRCRGVDTLSSPVFADDRGSQWLSSDYWHFTYTHFDVPNNHSCIERSNLAMILTTGSRHSGGVNTLFADGSVRFVSSHVDINVWRSAGTRNGGESNSGLY